jgi:hypothetical protein
LRWETVLGSVSGDAVTVGWMSKAGRWSITDTGREATSVEHKAGTAAMNGFLIDMPQLFQDFVTVALGS